MWETCGGAGEGDPGLQELVGFVNTGLFHQMKEKCCEDTEVKAEDCARKYEAVAFVSPLKCDSSDWLCFILW